MFNFIKNQKENLTPEVLCEDIDESGNLVKFVKTIFDLDFYDKPNYENLG